MNRFLAEHVAPPGAETVTCRELEVKGAQTPLTAVLCTPAATPEGLVVFFPGGGFMESELEEGLAFLQLLAARTGWLVLGSSYRPARVCPFPAAAEDAHAALLWAQRQRRDRKSVV